MRDFGVIQEAYKRSLVMHALGGDEPINRTFAANNLDPKAMKRIIRLAEHDAGVAMNAGDIGWSDVYLAGILLGLELVGKTEDRDRIIIER